MTQKQNILKAMSLLPENASIEDAMEKLYLLSKIEKGIHQADLGKLFKNDEAMKRIEACLK